MGDLGRHKKLRSVLIEHLRNKGIRNEAVLQAMADVPRHFFMDSSFGVYKQYEDKAMPIIEGQTISQPYTVAVQTSLLEPQKGQKILEVGTGSGYQACILAKLGVKLYTIERIQRLYLKTSKLLKNLSLKDMDYKRIKCIYADGYQGLPLEQPFDGIIVTAAAPYVPNPLLEQLKIGGKLVIPVGDTQKGQKMLRFIKTETIIHTEEHGNFKFVPMKKGRIRSIEEDENLKNSLRRY